MAKYFTSLRVRLVLFVLLAALPALGLTFYTGLEQRRKTAIAAQDEILRLARISTVNQEIFIENTRSFLIALTHLPALRQNDMSACQDIFSHLMEEHYPYYASFYVADLNGNVVCNAPNTHVPDRLAECEHYNTMLVVQDFVVSNYHICKATNKAILSMGYPIFDDNGEMILVINISLDLAWINEVAAESDLPPGSVLVVFDPQGTIIAHYPNPEEWIGKPLPEDSPLHELLARSEGTLVAAGLDGRERLYAMSPMGTGTKNDDVQVIMGIPTEIAFAEANRSMTRNLLLIGAATLLAILAALLLGDLFIMRQTRSLVETTQRLANGDLSARTTVPHDQGELGQLAGSFDQMAASLEQRKLERDRAERAMQEYATELERSNRELQDFANVASHDMQEPLRKILTFSELLLRRYYGVIDERGEDYLTRMDLAAHRLYDLINDLLAYSRVTTRAQPFTRVDLNEIARRVISDFDLQIEEAGAGIEKSPLPTIEADPTQMYQLLQNLISNALKYQQPDQEPQIQISSPPSPTDGDGYRQLWVSDNGIGFDEKYLDRIFQPFQRLHGRDIYDGTGMGLAICRKIVERHGGSITAQSTPGQGTTVIINLPVSQHNGEEHR